MTQGNNKSGFTLIELLLAMSFIAVLLLAIAMLIIRTGAIYSKGMALKDINQSSRSIADDFKRTLASERVGELNTKNYVNVPATGSAVSGRFCTGAYSYVWNTIDAVKDDGYAIAASTSEPELVTLVRLPDPGSVYCARNTDGSLLVRNTLREGDLDKATQLLTKGDHTLSLTNISFRTSGALSDPITGQRLLAIDFGLGSGKPSTMNPERTACLPASNRDADPLYCNIRQFNITVRTGGI